MATTERAVKLTYEDYCATPDDKRCELLNGDLMMVPAPNVKHQRILLRLVHKLGQFILDHELEELLPAPCDVVLSDTDVVQPDLLFVSRAREHAITAENVREAPDLVIEILSPSTADKDLGYKHEFYGRHGVNEYWVFDPTAETVAIHRQRDGVLELVDTLGRRGTLRTPFLRGLEIQLDEVLTG